MAPTCLPGANPWVERWFRDCIYEYVCATLLYVPQARDSMTSRDMTGFVLGLLSIGFWIVAQVPQMITNYRRQAADALSAWFLAEWLLGDTFNLLGCLLKGDQLPTVVITAQYFVCIDTVLLLQYMYYSGLQRRRERTYSLRHRHGHGHRHRHRRPHPEEPAALQASQPGLASLEGPLLSANSLARSAEAPRPDAPCGALPLVLAGTSPFETPAEPAPRSSLAALAAAAGSSVLGSALWLRRPWADAEDFTVPQAGEPGAVRASRGVARRRLLREDSGAEAASLADASSAQRSLLLSTSARLDAAAEEAGSHSPPRRGLVRPGLSVLGAAVAGAAGAPLAQGARGSGSLPRRRVALDAAGSKVAVGTAGLANRTLPPWARTLGGVLAYASSVLYLCSRVSQVVKNATRRSVEGLALSMFLVAICANTTYGMSILVRARDWPAVRSSLPWLIGSLGTVLLDVTILAQAAVFRRRARMEGAGELESQALLHAGANKR